MDLDFGEQREDEPADKLGAEEAMQQDVGGGLLGESQPGDYQPPVDGLDFGSGEPTETTDIFGDSQPQPAAGAGQQADALVSGLGDLNFDFSEAPQQPAAAGSSPESKKTR